MPPAGLAATARCPGGYGIRPYAVGVDACIDSEPRRLPHVAFLGPLCEGAPPAGGGGENPAAIRNFTGYGKVLSLRPCGPPPPQAEEALVTFNKVHQINCKNRVSVPDAFFKVVLCMTGEPKAIGFIYKNGDGNRPKGDYANSVDEVERITGIDFFPALPDEIEDKVEATCNPDDWNI